MFALLHYDQLGVLCLLLWYVHQIWGHFQRAQRLADCFQLRRVPVCVHSVFYEPWPLWLLPVFFQKICSGFISLLCDDRISNLFHCAGDSRSATLNGLHRPLWPYAPLYFTLSPLYRPAIERALSVKLTDNVFILWAPHIFLTDPSGQIQQFGHLYVPVDRHTDAGGRRSCQSSFRNILLLSLQC